MPYNNLEAKLRKYCKSPSCSEICSRSIKLLVRANSNTRFVFRSRSIFSERSPSISSTPKIGLRPVYAKGEYVAPLPQYTEGIEAVEDTSSVDALLIKEENTPKAAASFLPLLLPAVMIAVGSIGKLLVSEGSGAYTFFNTFGNTALALFCGIIAVGMLIFGRKKKVVDKANVDGNGCKVSEKSSWFEIVMNNWVVFGPA